jgi:hypothetical protein
MKRRDRILGPFPTGAVIADRQVGRIAGGDQVSPDREEWRAFDAWPELTTALAVQPPADTQADPQWLRERAIARQRWVDERSGSDRRSGEDARAQDERRTREAERRISELPSGGKRTSMRRRQPLGVEWTMLKIVVALAVAAVIVASLAWFYGPVNPVPVRIR